MLAVSSSDITAHRKWPVVDDILAESMSARRRLTYQPKLVLRVVHSTTHLTQCHYRARTQRNPTGSSRPPPRSKTSSLARSQNAPTC